MPRDQANLRDLTDLHLLILSALWARDEATIAEIHGSIGKRANVSTKTIGTLLGRLVQRKLVSRRAEGREGVYRALVSRREVLVARVGNALASVFAADDTVGAAALRRGEVKPGDADRLLELLRRAERDVTDR